MIVFGSAMLRVEKVGSKILCRSEVTEIYLWNDIDRRYFGGWSI